MPAGAPGEIDDSRVEPTANVLREASLGAMTSETIDRFRSRGPVVGDQPICATNHSEGAVSPAGDAVWRLPAIH